MSDIDGKIGELGDMVEKTRQALKDMALELSGIYDDYLETGRISDERLAEMKKLSEWLKNGGMNEL